MAIFLNFPAMGILILVSIVSLIHVGEDEFFSWAGWLSVLAAIVAPIGIGLWVRATSRHDSS